MSVDPAKSKPSRRAWRRHLSFLLRRLPGEIRGRSRQVPEAGEACAASAGAEPRALHLPDASADPAGRAGRLPDLRHGAGTAGIRRRAGPNPELTDMTRRFWIGAGARGAGAGAGDGRPFPGPEPAPHRVAAGFDVDPVRVRHAGRAVGRAGRSSSAAGPRCATAAQHVQPDRARHRRRLSLQPGRDLRARPVPGGLAAWQAAFCRSISRPPRSSPCWCCSGRCWNCAPASRPAAPSAPCSTSRPRPRGASRDGGADEEVPLDRVQVGDRLRIRPGDSVPVDGVVLEGRGAVDESMVTGESMPVDKEPGAKLIGGTINGTGALVMRAEKVGADTMLARIVAHGRRGAAQPRADPAPGRHGRRPGSCPRSSRRRCWPSSPG